jgi:hypothetical protein
VSSRLMPYATAAILARAQRFEQIEQRLQK